MPEHPSWLVRALTTADLLGDNDFINHVADILHVHPRKLTLSTDVYKFVRDRYRLAQIVQLVPSRNEKCGYYCDFFGGTRAIIEITSSCGTKTIQPASRRQAAALIVGKGGCLCRAVYAR